VVLGAHMGAVQPGDVAGGASNQHTHGFLLNRPGDIGIRCIIESEQRSVNQSGAGAFRSRIVPRQLPWTVYWILNSPYCC
jgi:hypothetical protein